MLGINACRVSCAEYILSHPVGVPVRIAPERGKCSNVRARFGSGRVLIKLKNKGFLIKPPPTRCVSHIDCFNPPLADDFIQISLVFPE